VAVEKRIERRLLRGRSCWEEETKAEYVEGRARSSLNRIHWLADHGCQFSFDVHAASAKLRKFAPEWREQYATKAASSLESRSGSVSTDTEYSALLTEPLATVISKATELRGRTHSHLVEHKPFAGLSAERPVRALRALSYSAKFNDYPEWAWRTFLNSEARKSDKPKFSALIAERLSRLPAIAIAQFIHPSSDWVRTSSKVLLSDYPKQFQNLWAKLIAVLQSDSESARSARIRGNKEPDWTTRAFSSPVGKLAEAVMNDPQQEGLLAGEGFPPSWITKVEELLSLRGDLRRHALVSFSFHLNWFFAIDPSWTEKNLMSVLTQPGDDQNAFWAGFFWGATTPHLKLYSRLKPYLLRLAQQQSPSQRDHTEVLSGILLVDWGTIDQETGERCVSNAEMRDVLINTNDDFRSQVLWQIERWLAEGEGWSDKLPVFLAEVWPRHRKTKSSKITARLCNLAFSDATTFFKIADVVVSLVTKFDQEHLNIPNLRKSNDTIVHQYPEKTLALLFTILPEQVFRWPYDMEDTLERIGKADPSLLKDSRLVELKRRWNAR